MNRNFEEWLKTFRDSINDYDYYTDFAKVYEHAERFKPEIYLANVEKMFGLDLWSLALRQIFMRAAAQS